MWRGTSAAYFAQHARDTCNRCRTIQFQDAQESAISGPNSTKCGPELAKLEQACSGIDHMWPNRFRADADAKLDRLGRLRSKLDRHSLRHPRASTPTQTHHNAILPPHTLFPPRSTATQRGGPLAVFLTGLRPPALWSPLHPLPLAHCVHPPSTPRLAGSSRARSDCSAARLWSHHFLV